VITAAGSTPLQLETTDSRKKHMPLSKYLKGKSEKVMSDTKAPANKYGMTADADADDKPKRKTIGQRIAGKATC
jgi:hypothetical protein